MWYTLVMAAHDRPQPDADSGGSRRGKRRPALPHTPDSEPATTGEGARADRARAGSDATGETAAAASVVVPRSRARTRAASGLSLSIGPGDEFLDETMPTRATGGGERRDLSRDPAAPHDGSDPFLAEAGATLLSLRRATSAVLSECGGLDRAVHVSTRLGLDRSLGWKVWQVGRGSAGYPSPAHIPGAQGYEHFLRAARAAGVAEETVVAARRAFAAFERLTASHAGNRASVDLMLGRLTDEGRTRLEVSLRRDGFRANAYLLGVQAAALYQVDALVDAGPRFHPEVWRIRGHFGLRRTGASGAWLISRSTRVDADGPTNMLQRDPLGSPPTPAPSALGDAPGAAAREAITSERSPILLPQFCSSPEPVVIRRTIPPATVEDELRLGHVGQLGEVDVVTGERVHSMPPPQSSRSAVTMSVLTPGERLCYDVVVHRDLFAGSRLTDWLRLRVHTTVQTDLPYLRGDDFATIPVPEQFEDLGAALDAPEAAEIPRQGVMLRWLLAQLPGGPGAYRLARVRLRYPPVPSVLAAGYPTR
jgi:hypothetical protein